MHTPCFVSAYWCDPHMVMGKARQGGGAIQGEWPSGNFQPDNISSLPHLCIPLCKMNIAHFKKKCIQIYSYRLNIFFIAMRLFTLARWSKWSGSHNMVRWSGAKVQLVKHLRHWIALCQTEPHCTTSRTCHYRLWLVGTIIISKSSRPQPESHRACLLESFTVLTFG